MSKIDQLRRQREQQHERQERQVPGPAVRARAEIAPVPAPVPAPARGATPLADEVKGSCSVCGKVRALKNGFVSDHQKGLGKMCTGSRKEPAPA